MAAAYSTWFVYLMYFAPLAFIAGLAVARRRRNHRTNALVFEECAAAGLTEPASLHPVIDTTLCIGCEACVHACPEYPAHRVLGVVRGKAQLVQATDCIGHGACKTACPVGAIRLVFGTAERGVDIPVVKPDFETNVPGVYIAGELGGMGLIRNAVEQGRQAMESIARMLGRPSGRKDAFDVLVVGAGPAGLAASLAAHERGLRYVTVDQESLGGTVAHFPRRKLVMTAPVKLPLVGEMRFGETSKEDLMEFWEHAVDTAGVRIRCNERVVGLTGSKGRFRVRTTGGEYEARVVLLALGRRGTPRKLGVPGEELPKVVYRLIDPDQYRGRRVLVVGGGDSALEAALTLSEVEGTDVTLSYRSSAFSRAKPKNRRRVEAATASGRMRTWMRSEVVEITEGAVQIRDDSGGHRIPNDIVLVCAGGILPTAFLQEIGIQVETKYGTV